MKNGLDAKYFLALRFGLICKNLPKKQSENFASVSPCFYLKKEKFPHRVPVRCRQNFVAAICGTLVEWIGLNETTTCKSEKS